MLHVKRQLTFERVILLGSMVLFGSLVMGLLAPVEIKRVEATGGIATFAAVPTSITLGISGSNKETLFPTSESYDVAKIDATVTVGLINAKGYSIQMQAATADLVGANNVANKIPAVSGVSTLANLPVNTWGYSIDGNTYRAAPTQSEEIYHSGSVAVTDTLVSREHTLSFVAKVDTQVAPDTYNNTVIVSVVAEPGVAALTAFNGIKNMQDLTPSICKDASENDMAYLTDARDGNKYWVTKLKDGNCWMSQNLALDLTKGKSVQGSKVVSGTTMATYNFTPEATTLKPSDGDERFTKGNESAIYSWNEGKYVVIKPSGMEYYSYGATAADGGLHWFADDSKLSAAGISVGSTSARVEDFGIVMNVDGSWWKPATDPYFTESNVYIQDGVSYSKVAGWAVDPINKVYDAHYLVGNYYQWFAATAQTAAEAQASRQLGVSTSICPVNWRVPDYGTINSLSYSFKNSNFTDAPLFFARFGEILPYLGTYDFPRAYLVGSYGYIWSSTRYANTGYDIYTMRLQRDSNTTVSPDRLDGNYGASIRCVVVSQ